jgi:hypothetical protein
MWPDLDPDSMAAFHLDQNMLSEEEAERPVTCRYCKRDGFYWEQTPKGWRLTTETGKLHKCGAYRK